MFNENIRKQIISTLLEQFETSFITNQITVLIIIYVLMSNIPK